MPPKLSAKYFYDCSPWISDREDCDKSWGQVFLQKNRRQHDRPFRQCLQQEDVKRDPIDSFLQYTDNSIPSRGVQQAKKVLNKIANNKTKLLNPRRAWVDSRTRALGQQSSPRWVKSDELGKFIQERSTNALSDTDAVRRLIFIQELDYDFVRAIAQTSSWNEVSALRLATRNHLARETCIQVRIPYIGFATFHLEFSLPYLVLEEQDSSNASQIDNGSATELLKTNLSFLSTGSREDHSATQFSIRKVHETVLIFGCDSSEWTGYAFSSLEWSTDNINEDEDDNDEMPNEDIFATGCTDYDDHHVLDASAPIWDPRVYFLSVFAIRVQIIYERYEFLISTLRLEVQDWISHSIYAVPSSSSSSSPEEEIKILKDNIKQIRQVLHELITCLERTVAVWERFHSVDGDFQYFSDIKDRKARLAIKNTKANFEKLKFELHQFESLERTLNDATITLTLELTDQRNINAKETLMHIMDLSKHNKLSQKFVEENNKLNQEFVEENIKIAKANSKIARTNIRLSRANVALLIVTTSIAVALQYFCSERNFLSIDRSPKAFVLSIPILLILLSLVAPCVQIFQLALSMFPALLTKIPIFERIKESSVFKKIDKWMGRLYLEVDEVENNVWLQN
ncbi:hypothetical protein COCMIDRAFT_6045 [Bipolaris oryzae ATCC 44560]|uniref:Uncharacterized protein n=1 Tax=Bipolaris oryzae ATCC 44560 TaxID=930090 RepID=W6YZG4_COCMI|nr:uncharacterized protein COCMIDRAFT_6045 [Bipolaris oryzae ATCC 44560]EUC44712.1 hypothetical protein COCMIDRAFT_6045 [Bipolaris oryzae ATCC 44560]